MKSEPEFAPAAPPDIAPMPLPALIKLPPIKMVRVIEASESAIVAREPVSTIRNLPSTMLSRFTGLHSSASIVPRSFSPAVRSIAGYIAPVKHSMMIK